MREHLSLIAAGLCLASMPAIADGDPEDGERVFRKCVSFHAVGDDAKNKVGPILNGIVGAPAGQNPEFHYSDALLEAAAAGLIWDEKNLFAYLRKPRDLIDGTKMTFAGLRDDDDIEDVIAYLATFP